MHMIDEEYLGSVRRIQQDSVHVNRDTFLWLHGDSDSGDYLVNVDKDKSVLFLRRKAWASHEVVGNSQ